VSAENPREAPAKIPARCRDAKKVSEDFLRNRVTNFLPTIKNQFGKGSVGLSAF
jgi:hypothetical protein